jgi:hypothetical protein
VTTTVTKSIVSKFVVYLELLNEIQCPSVNVSIEEVHSTVSTRLILSLHSTFHVAASRTPDRNPVTSLKLNVCLAIHEAGELTSPIMNYSKKDEDAESAIMRVDRTSVFQEGQPCAHPLDSPFVVNTTQHDYSTPPPYSHEDAESYSQKLLFSSTRANDSLQTKPRLYSLVSRSCSRTKMPAYDRWFTLLSRSWLIPPRISLW